MSSKSVAHKSFLFSFSLIGIICLGLGVFFFCIAVASQFIPIDYSTVTVTTSGVERPATPETISHLRRVFLLICGAVALLLILPGALCLRHTAMRKKKAQRLRTEGLLLMAKATECEISGIYIYNGWTPSLGGISFSSGIGWSSCRGNYSRWRGRNRHHLVRLHCSYKDSDGVSHSFRSDLLREDPLPQLSKRQVVVYRDRTDPSCSFVDVDESARLGGQTE